MLPGTVIPLSSLTGNPTQLIKRIKYLIDEGATPYIKFDEDYKILMKGVGYVKNGVYIWLIKEDKLTPYIVGSMVNKDT